MMSQHTIASLEGARVLVTGGAGLVGSHIVDQLLAEEVEQVIVLDNFIRGCQENLEAALRSDRVQIVQGDIRDSAMVQRCMDGGDYVFHQAAIPHHSEQIARAFNEMYGLPYVALRYFNVYGPRMDVTGAYTEVFIRWLDCIERNERPKIFGDDSQSMDFIYIQWPAKKLEFGILTYESVS